jgi:hypothetical protein
VLRDSDKANFETLKRAAANDDLALMDARRKSDDAKVALVAAVYLFDDEYRIVPLAVMIEGDPYEDFVPFPENESE